jgi:hypothetical protein
LDSYSARDFVLFLFQLGATADSTGFHNHFRCNKLGRDN